MKLTTEQILTSPDGFGLASATPVQRAACRARDGLPLRELAEHPDVVAAFGGADALRALPGERGAKPTTFWNIASARTAKTTLAVAAAVADSQSLDVTGLGHGEVPRISVLSLKLDVADVPFTRLAETLRASRVLRGLVIGEPTGTILRVRHPSGRPIEIAVVAGGRAGGGLAARWSGGLIADEAPRMVGRDEAVANLDDALATIHERLLPGAQIMAIGSPWAPRGPAYDAVTAHFGKPTEHVVVMRTTGPAGNPRYWTRERLERLRETNETAWRINALGEFLDPETGLFNPVSLRSSTRESPAELPPEAGGDYVAAVDPSEGTATGNAFTLVIVKREREGEGDNARQRLRVAVARQWRGIGPDAVWSEVAGVCARYGVRNVTSDGYAASANVDLARRHRLTLHIRKASAASKLDDFTNLATLVHAGAIELPPDRVFKADLLSVRKRATANGYTIVLPKTGDGRHADFAAALALVVFASSSARPPNPWIAALERAEPGSIAARLGFTASLDHDTSSFVAEQRRRGLL